MSERYGTIVADPPWDIRTPDGWHTNSTRDALPYRRMSVEQIAGLPVGAMADATAHLYLWTVQRYVEASYEIARGWGFMPRSLLTWCKEPRGMGPGGLFASTTEFILFARRGTDGVRGSKHPTNWFQWPRGEHSAKPDAFLDIVERVSPGPYAELFARRARFGWDYPIGDQALGGVAA